jgi:hypothetical protein
MSDPARDPAVSVVAAGKRTTYFASKINESREESFYSGVLMNLGLHADVDVGKVRVRVLVDNETLVVSLSDIWRQLMTFACDKSLSTVWVVGSGDDKIIIEALKSSDFKKSAKEAGTRKPADPLQVVRVFCAVCLSTTHLDDANSSMGKAN